jgi:hypothetical protein
VSRPGTDAAPAWLADARTVADVVLFEGYVLYPYGARSDRNRVRFQWGVLSPAGAEHDAAGEGPDAHTDVLVQGDPAVTITATLRFLQVVERELLREDGPVGEIELADGGLLLPWTEATVHEETVGPVALATLLRGDDPHRVVRPGDERHEPVVAADGAPVTVRRRSWPLTATLTLTAVPVGAACRLRLTVRNDAAWTGGDRDRALRSSLVGTHVVVHTDGGAFVALRDPPAHLRRTVDTCEHHRLWPVLLGEAAAQDTVLASPVILDDHPEIAPESPGDLYDATEIDELLTLRVMTLTDDEKRDARATDPRAATIVDRADHLPPEVLERLHGAVRHLAPAAAPDPFATSAPWWDPGADASVSPTTDTVPIGGVAVGRGTKVWLRPSRRADAHDVFLDGRVATVAAVLHDVDGGIHLAITVDDDPGADLYDATGRYRYFDPDEVEPLPEQEDLP